MTTPNVRFTIGKPLVMLKEFFGLHSGQTSAQFAGEMKQLSTEDRTEVEQMVAAEVHQDSAAAKRFGITIDA